MFHLIFGGSTRRARFSEDRVYRYTLEIEWGEGSGTCNFLMLNPSTADEVRNDPTVERCERRARDWGYRRLIVTNIFAFRATDPRDMKAEADPVGPENDAAILAAAQASDLVIAAWGNHGTHLRRAEAVRKLLSPMSIKCLRVSKGGQPGHPLYVSYDVEPVDWH